MAPTKLSDADKQEIVECYRRPEETASTLAKRYGVSNSTISRILKSGLASDEYDALVQVKRATKGSGATIATAPPDAASAPIAPATDDTQSTPKKSTPKKKKSAPPSPAPVSADDSIAELDEVAEAAAAPITVVDVVDDSDDSPVAIATGSEGQDLHEDLDEDQDFDDDEVAIAGDEDDFTTGAPAKPILKDRKDGPAETASGRGSRRRSRAQEAADTQLELLSSAPDSAEDDDDDDDLEPDEIIVERPQKNSKQKASSGRRAVAPTVDDDDDEEDYSDGDLDDDDFSDEDDFEDDDDDDDDDDGLGTGAIANQEIIQILPMTDEALPQQCYLVVDRASELITLPLKDFRHLGQIPEAEVQELTLPIFDNHRIARRFSRRNQRVVKVPDGRMIEKTLAYLQAKGITRLLIDGQVYALSDPALQPLDGDPAGDPADND